MRIHITLPQRLADLVERASWTVFQAAAVVLLAAPTLNASGAEAAAVAGIAAGLSVVKTFATGWLATTKRNPNVVLDTLQRGAWTFVEVAIGVAIVDPGSGTTWQLAATSGAAAALAVVKGVLAVSIGKPSAATLPASLDPSPVPVCPPPEG